jgi:hypothetical protein
MEIIKKKYSSYVKSKSSGSQIFLAHGTYNI